MFASLDEMRRLIAELPVPAYVWDIATQRFVVANSMLLEIAGYSESELFRLDWRELLVPGEISRAEKAISSGVSLEATRWYWRTKQGRIVTVVISGRQTQLAGAQGERRAVRISVITGLGANVSKLSDSEF